MKFILAVEILLASICYPFTQNAGIEDTEYVCTPCGRDCDKTVYHEAGSCPHCGMTLVDKASADIKNLSFEEVCARLKANPKAVLLDVRTTGEFNGTTDNSFGHFANAININVEELSGRLGEISKYKDREVIVYCSHSHRSPRASYELKRNGFKNVENVAGGVSTITESEKACLKEKFVSHPGQ